MKIKVRAKLFILIISLLALSALAACGKTVDSTTATTYSAMAEETIKLLVEKDYEALTARFDAQMKAALSVEQLKEIEPVLASAGDYIRIEKSTVQEKEGLYTTVSVIKFINKTHVVTVTYNNDNEIAGLFIQ